jgi:drug/metabolite transporter (DMT)-like permease
MRIEAVRMNDANSGPDATEAARQARRKRLFAILLMVCATVCLACLDTTAKWLNADMNPLQTTFARYLVSMILIAAMVNPVTSPGLLRARRPWLQAGRSLLLLFSTMANFFSLRYLQLAEATAIIFAAPLIVALLSGPLLGEKVGPRRMAAVAVGFVGVLIVMRPGLGALHPIALLSFCGAVSYALYTLSTRFLAAHDSTHTTLFYSGLAGVILLAPVLPFIWTWPRSGMEWALLLSTGAWGGLGHFLLIVAHRRAPAAVLAPFIYTQMVWMLVFGWFVFGQIPDMWTLIGAGIVVASGLYLLYRERVVRGGT